ncbi:MAG: NAD(P)/FAD-dependent oxidoreductase [Arenicella sp.]
MKSYKKASSSDVAIIGAGIIGLMLARQLHGLGLKVQLIEKNPQAAMEASQAGGGIISPLHPWRYSKAMLDLADWSHEHFPVLVKDLGRRTGVYVPLLNTGMLVPDTEEAEAALSCDFLQAEVVTSQRVFEIEPGLAEPRESVWVPAVNSVRNPALCRALTEDMRLSKIPVSTSTAITEIDHQADKFVIRSDFEQFEAQRVVIASGAWSEQVYGLFGAELRSKLSALPEIFPVKGQMLAFKTRPGVLRSVILNQHRYLIPRHDGVVLSGSTTEHVGFDKQLTADAFDDLYQFAVNTLPALSAYPVIAQWAGLRPGSHVDSPIISAVPQVPGLFLSAGHFRNGLLSSPASAQLMADLITGAESDFDIDLYSLRKTA